MSEDLETGSNGTFIYPPKHFASIIEDHAKALRTGEKAADRIEELEAALKRQTTNMAFVLNRVDLRSWHERFEDDLQKDRKLL